VNEKISRNKKERKSILSYLFPIIFILFWILIIPLISQSSKTEKQFDKKLWNPWLEIKNENIKYIELHPIIRVGYDTISNVVKIKDKILISEIKEDLNRKPMDDIDGVGYHWSSRKRLRITAYTEKGEFSFLLFLHDDFPSIQYQMLIPTKEKNTSFNPQQCPGFFAEGGGWRSARLYSEINQYIDNSNKVHWREY